jgi:hypothetical protein
MSKYYMVEPIRGAWLTQGEKGYMGLTHTISEAFKTRDLDIALSLLKSVKHGKSLLIKSQLATSRATCARIVEVEEVEEVEK